MRENASTGPPSIDVAFPNGKIVSAVQLGHLIRQRRKASGIRLVEAAGLAGVGVRFLSELERGKATASLGKTLQVLQRLGLEVWLFPRGKGPRRAR
ncbi:MAG: helix-turn-helix domain-containing protein [Myxococcaceae bacterium]